MKKIKYIAWILVFCILISSIAYAATTKKIEDLKGNKKKIEEQMQEKHQEVQSINTEIGKINAEIKELDDKISESQNKLDNIQSKVSNLETEISVNTKNLKIAEDQLSEKEDVLCERLREIYKSGDVAYLEVLLGSSDIVEMLTKAETLKLVMKQDEELINFTKKQINYISDTKTLLKEQKTEYEKQIALEKSEKEKLEVANTNKLNYMSTLQQNREVAEKQYDDFVKQTESISEQILKLEKELEEKRKREEERRKKMANFIPSGSGDFIWPLEGYSSISSYFGYRVHPIFGVTKFHSGIDIPAPSGTPVSAAAEGIVISSGWQGGYGNCVMISHGNGLVTVYGHNSSLKVKVGDYVATGDTISLCGSTGVSTGSHLHFEVRVNGKPQDPFLWL